MNSNYKTAKLYRIQERELDYPTWLIEDEYGLWRSWTGIYKSIYRVAIILIQGNNETAEEAHLAYRKDLIKKIKSGEYKNCLVAKKIK